MEDSSQQNTNNQGDQGKSVGQQQDNKGQVQGSQGMKPIMEEDVDVSSLIQNAGNKQKQDDFLANTKLPAHPNTTFDEQLFLNLLASSISLTFKEKENIVNAVPQLVQKQIDELMAIFKDEQEKFSEIEKKHAEKLAEMEKDNEEWKNSGYKEKEEQKKNEEESKVDDIKKKLGL